MQTIDQSLSCNVLQEAYLAKVYLIEDNLIGMTYAPEPRNESERCDDCQGDFVIPLRSRPFAVQFGPDKGI